MRDTIVSVLARLRAGAATAVELVEASLAAIATHNPSTNAFISVDLEGARAAARTSDHARASGLDLGPLHGIPISLKDLIDQAGVVTTAGSHVLDDRIPTEDASVVTRLRRAGAIIIGRTNLHEFALGTTSEDSAFGPVRNPHDLRRSAGGSSGGSAAAVATGMGLASIGTDTGGSIRIPAAACGIVGLKPSAGEVPTDGIVPLSPTLDHVGPLATTVEDAGWILAVLAGRTPALVAPVPLGHLRLTRLGGYFAAPLDETVGPVFEEAMAALRAAGAKVRDAEIEGTAAIAGAYRDIVLSEAARWHATLLDTRAERYTPNVRARIEQGRGVTPDNYLAAREVCRILRRAVDAALEGSDALVLPTLPIVAPMIGATDVPTDQAASQSMPLRTAMLKHTQLFNLTGHPAISLPIATTGLPVGLQLVGRIGETVRLLQIAAACEALVAGR